MSFVTADVFSFVRRDVKYKPRQRWDSPAVIESVTHKWNHFFSDVVSEDDTYVLIFTSDFNSPYKLYQGAYEWLVVQPEVKVLYQSPPAVNTRHSSTQLRNFVLVFEWQKPLPAQDVEKTEKTQEETISLPSVTVENTVSPVDTTEGQEMAELYRQDSVETV